MDVHHKMNVFFPFYFSHNALCVIYHTYHLNTGLYGIIYTQHRESGPGVKVFVYDQNGMPYCAAWFYAGVPNGSPRTYTASLLQVYMKRIGRITLVLKNPYHETRWCLVEIIGILFSIYYKPAIFFCDYWSLYDTLHFSLIPGHLVGAGYTYLITVLVYLFIIYCTVSSTDIVVGR